MKLYDRIEKDLTELYNGGTTHGEIQNALALNGLIQAVPGQTSFATKALPGYYTGDRKAKTVMVMLNPGMDVDEANNNLKCDICKRSMKNAGDVTAYHKWCENYGHIDKYRFDNFDVKQAFFLHKWPDTGITLPASLCANPKSDKQTLLDAKEAVLTQKLQLELIPYASNSFSNFDKSKIHLLFPFVETLFDEIFSLERNYVIFCSKLFNTIFSEFEKQHKETIKPIGNPSVLSFAGSKLKGSCNKVSITYNNKTIKALIANTFPHQALPNAYKLMEEYGEFCYKNYP